VVSKALEPDPADRFQTAGEMEAALLRTLDASRPRRGRPSVAAAGWISALLVAVLGGLLALLVVNSQQPPIAGRAKFCSGSSPLRSGDRLQIGDPVALEFQCTEKVHVYVLNEDEFGVKHILFPIVGGEARNPLAPGKVHRLPSEGLDWQVASRGGEEWLCVMASREPIDALEGVLASAEAGGGESGIGYLRIEGVSEGRFLRSLAKLAPRKQTSSALAPRETRLRELVDKLVAEDELDPARKKLWVQAIRIKSQ
jgi:hypothetical protein